MKNYIKLLIITAAAITAATSCLKDLDQLPLNPQDVTVESAYGADEGAYLSGLSKIYFELVSNDLTDLSLTDGGASELIRAYWSLNENSTDEAKCAWGNDGWVEAVNTNTWSDAANDASTAVYCRTLHGITFVNEFLKQTADDKLTERGCSDELKAKIAGMRAEARFMRAFYYFIAMDVFGRPAFVTENSPFGAVYPKQAERADVFNYIETELKELVADGSAMPAARSNYPRADVGACWALLARLYLNAEVYTGTARWEDAKNACEKVIGLGYDLATNYSDIFRGDNGDNPDVLKELIFAAGYHATQTQTYGGTTLLTQAAIASVDVSDTQHPNGVGGDKVGWAGLVIPVEFINKYFAPTKPALDADGKYVSANYTCADKRGQMFRLNYGADYRYEDIPDKTALITFKYGWACLKYNNIPHDKTADEFNEDAKLKVFSDIDFPLFRLAEIYLIYAEACMNLGSANDATALGYLKKLTDRAGVAAPTAITQEYLLAERARELLWEGHRRTDLIRYKLFNSDTFLWPFKGGVRNGKGFPEYMNVFALPPEEMTANPELVQNDGYTVK